jgi:malate dehydrogenase
LLIGAKPRGPGMERKDLLMENAKIFIEQGKALNDVASRNVKVLVVGNPANTNAYIAMKSAPSLPAKFHRHAAPGSQPRHFATGHTHRQSGCGCRKNARLGQPLAHHVSGSALYTVAGQPAPAAINDEAWYKNDYIPTVGKRGAAIIAARGASSAASAANAAIDHMRDWALGTNGKWVTMGVPSDGSYGIPQDIIYGVPVTCENGVIQARGRPGHRRLFTQHDG